MRVKLGQLEAGPERGEVLGPACKGVTGAGWAAEWGVSQQQCMNARRKVLHSQNSGFGNST